MHRALASITLIVALAGCATPYQPSGWAGGYRDFRIASDTFEVSFNGNGYTGRQRVSRYVLRRAAEVTLLHGFTHFETLSETDWTDTHVSSNRQATYTFHKPSNTTRIRCHTNPERADYLIDAREYLRYNFPKALNRFPEAPNDPIEEPDG